MRIPARAAGPLVAMAIAAASFGCIAPAAYAENATAAVISDDGDHVVVDVDLNGSAPVGDATEQADMKRMVVPLIASALLLDFLGCMMPLALVEDTKAFKVGVFLIWAALVADSVLMGLFYPRELAGVNPLLAAGLESICLICAMYPLHGFASNLAPCGIRVDTAAALAFIDFLVTAVGCVSLLLGTIWLIFF